MWPIWVTLLRYASRIPPSVGPTQSICPLLLSMGFTTLNYLQGPVLSQSCARLGTDSDHDSPLQVETVDGVIKNRIESYERAINRDEAALKRQEKQVKSEIKKMAKIGNKEAFSFSQRACTTMETANRNFCPKYKSHFYIHTNKSDKFPDEDGCAKSATAKTTQAVDKKMNPQKTLQKMQNFQQENMKMTEEMTDDTPEDIFDGSDDEEESQDTMNQVLDEIGIEISGNMAKAVSSLKLTI